ncbi:hypothetical protein D3C72_426880 [compost metagenome]
MMGERRVDQSVFSKNHHGRFCDSDLLRELFETVRRRCMTEGRFVEEGFAVDASHRLTKADIGTPPVRPFSFSRSASVRR